MTGNPTETTFTDMPYRHILVCLREGLSRVPKLYNWGFRSLAMHNGQRMLFIFPLKWTYMYWERFSFECRKVIGFAFTTLCDWFKKLAPLFHPIRSKTKNNRDSLIRVFPRFGSAACNHFVFWLVHLIVCVLCDWLEWLLWFWFYDTQLKTALTNI